MKATKRFKGSRDKELPQIPTGCMGTSKASYARKREKKRQLVIRSLFEELFNFLPEQMQAECQERLFYLILSLIL